jgi:hypothetical protein
LRLAIQHRRRTFTEISGNSRYSWCLPKKITSVKERTLILWFDIRKQSKQFMEISGRVQAIA